MHKLHPQKKNSARKKFAKKNSAQKNPLKKKSAKKIMHKKKSEKKVHKIHLRKNIAQNSSTKK